MYSMDEQALRLAKDTLVCPDGRVDSTVSVSWHCLALLPVSQALCIGQAHTATSVCSCSKNISQHPADVQKEQLPV